jgi:hypothetical protein
MERVKIKPGNAVSDVQESLTQVRQKMSLLRTPSRKNRQQLCVFPASVQKRSKRLKWR